MANLRVKCSCGEVVNGVPGSICPRCKQPLVFPEDAAIYLYRKGSPLGIAGGFGIYINGEPYGHIGNKETLCFPLKYGSYNLHIATGMNRRCNDLVFNLSPEHRIAYTKVWMKPGFWSNSFVLEVCSQQDMPL
ncbi:MAG: hypothetical protein Q4A12_04070 [Eubacteriales bacterium]|nr:hypothetical protein [Eubacteriales bacterium]